MRDDSSSNIEKSNSAELERIGWLFHCVIIRVPQVSPEFAQLYNTGPVVTLVLLSEPDQEFEEFIACFEEETENITLLYPATCWPFATNDMTVLFFLVLFPTEDLISVDRDL